MQPFPHRYEVEAGVTACGDVTLECKGLPALTSAPPREFDGPGDRWSPETLLVAAVADCFALTFRAIAAANQLQWIALTCEAAGTVERIDRITRFTAITLRVGLRIADDADRERARRLLERAEQSCLIGNSLKAQVSLETDIDVVRTAA